MNLLYIIKEESIIDLMELKSKLLCNADIASCIKLTAKIINKFWKYVNNIFESLDIKVSYSNEEKKIFIGVKNASNFGMFSVKVNSNNKILFEENLSLQDKVKRYIPIKGANEAVAEFYIKYGNQELIFYKHNLSLQK